MRTAEGFIEAPWTGELHRKARWLLRRLFSDRSKCNLSRHNALEDIAGHTTADVRFAKRQLNRVRPAVFQKFLFVFFLQAIDVITVLREVKFEGLHRDLPIRQLAHRRNRSDLI